MILELGGPLATHKDYQKALPNWQKVDDLINSDVDKYLRNVGSTEKDKVYATARQAEYVDGAILHNFTLKTRDGMKGAIFLRAPTIDLPSQLEYLLDDCDGAGLDLLQQSQGAVDQDLRKGRAGLLVDMPTAKEVPTLAQQESGEMVPRIQMYEAQDIINWHTVRYGSINKLHQIVLREEYDANFAGGFGDTVPQYQYRVLGIDGDGYYYQQVWYADRDEKLHSLTRDGQSVFYPRQNGQLMKELPFYFIGADNNSYHVGTQPLLPIAQLNIGHYRNSADTEENSFVCSQAMLVLSPGENISPDKWMELNPDGVMVGSRRGLNVGAGGSATFIQAAESDKAMRLMQNKEEQAVQLGAQLITPSQQVTAEAARIQQGANGSILSNIAQNVTAAYRKAIEQCALFLNVTEEFDFSLSNDFFYQAMTAQERAQWVSEIMTGITPIDLFYDKLRQTGEYPDDYTNDDIAKMLKDQPPLGLELGLDDSGGDLGVDDEQDDAVEE